MENCGDDFLVALAESMEGNEDWDDLQALETEACETLAEMFDNDVHKNFETGNNEASTSHVHVIDDSPEPKKHQNLMHLDSSSDGEDTDFVIPRKCVDNSIDISSHKRSGPEITQSAPKRLLTTMVKSSYKILSIYFNIWVVIKEW